MRNHPILLILPLATFLADCTRSSQPASPDSASAGPPPVPLPPHVLESESKCPTPSGRRFVDDMAVSSDGTRLIANTRFGDDGAIELWDLASRTRLLRTPAFGGISSFSFAEGHGTLVTRLGEVVTLFSLKDGAKIVSIPGVLQAVSSGGEMDFPSGNPADHKSQRASLFALINAQGIEIRSTADGSLMRTIERGPEAIQTVHFIGEGLLLGITKKGSKVWRIQDGELVKVFDVEIEGSTRGGGLVFSREGTALQLWRLPSFAPLRTIRFETDVLTVEADPSDSMLLVRTRQAAFQIPLAELTRAGDTVVVGSEPGFWQAFPAKAEFTLSIEMSGSGFETPFEPEYESPNGGLWTRVNPRDASGPFTCVACSPAHGIVIWSATHENHKLPGPSFVWRTTFGGSSDAKVVTVAGPRGMNGSELWVYRPPAVSAIYDVDAMADATVVTPDGSTLVASFNDASIRVWGLGEGRFLGCLAGD